MFYLLPFGLFQSIANALATAFKWVFDKVLTPVLKLVIMQVVQPVVELVIKALYDILQPLLLLVLQLALALLDVIEQAFNIFSGTSPILIKQASEADFSNAKREYLMNVIFGQNTVSRSFWYITLIAFILTLAFTVVSVARSTMDLEGKRPVGKVMGSTGKAMLTFLMVPFVVICSINLSSMVLVKSSEAISLSSGMPNTTIGTHLFLTLCSESYGSQYSSEQSKEALRAAYAEPNDQTHTYMNTKQVEADFDVKTIKYFSGYIVCISLAFMMITASFLFIVRIFEVVILYIVSPFFVSVMPLDDGARFKSWRELFIAKLVSGFGMVFAMKIYILLIPVLLGTNVRFFDDVYKNTLMQLIFLVGGSFAVVKSNSLIMQAVNPQAAMTEAAGAASAMGFATGAAMGGLRMGKGAAAGMGRGMKSMGQGIKSGVKKGADGVKSARNLRQARMASLESGGGGLNTGMVMSNLPKSWSSAKKAQGLYKSYTDYKQAKADKKNAASKKAGDAAGKKPASRPLPPIPTGAAAGKKPPSKPLPPIPTGSTSGNRPLPPTPGSAPTAGSSDERTSRPLPSIPSKTPTDKK